MWNALLILLVGFASAHMVHNYASGGKIDLLDVRIVASNALRISYNISAASDEHKTTILQLSLGEIDDNCKLARSNSSARTESLRITSFKAQTYTFWNAENLLAPNRTLTICGRVNGTDWVSMTYDVHEEGFSYPPVIEQGPENVVNHRYVSRSNIFSDNDHLELKCLTMGSPQPRIQWFCNGTELDRRTLSSFNFIVARNGSLIIPEANFSHEGTYKCRAANVHGSVTSSSVELVHSVLMDFPRTGATKRIEIKVGEGFKLECHPTRSIPPPTILWRIVGEADQLPEIVGVETERISQGLDGSLVFTNVQSEDSGKYICEVMNKYTSYSTITSWDYELRVTTNEDFPTVVHQPTLKYSQAKSPAIVGKDFIMQCLFVGNPSPWTFWYKEDTIISNSSLQTYNGLPKYSLSVGNKTLIIHNVTSGDQGRYRCEGSNSIGPSSRAEFTVIVNERPRWSVLPRSSNVTIGDNVVVPCRATGEPKPVVSWTINGISVTRGKHSRVSISGFRRYEINGTDSDQYLIVYNVTLASTSAIQCLATNLHGNITAFIYLKVLHPTTISNISITSSDSIKSSDVTTLSCDAETDVATALKISWFLSNKSETGYREIVKSEIINNNNINKNNITLLRSCSLTTNDGYLDVPSEKNCPLRGIVRVGCVATNGYSSRDHWIDLAKVLGRSTDPSDVTSVKYGEVVTGGPVVETKDDDKPNFTAIALLVGVTAAVVAVAIICTLVALVVRRKRRDRVTEMNGLHTLVLAQSLMRRCQRQVTSPAYIRSSLQLPNVNERLVSVLGECLIDLARLKLGRLIGKGQFGRVYGGLLTDEGGKTVREVAVKTLRYKPEETEMVELFLREAVMMKDFEHENVLSLIGVCIDFDGSPMVLLPFMANGDLRLYIQNPDRDLTVLELLRLGLQVSKGMVYLSSKRFVHRDLAARNCMVDEYRMVKVADFGLSRDLFSRDYYRTDDYRSPLPVRWLAPECLSQGFFTTASDTWSFGVLLWELMTRGATPYGEYDNHDIARIIADGTRLPMPPFCPEAVFQIMQRCWVEQPHLRPTFEMLVDDLSAVIRSARSASFSTHRKFYVNIAGLKSNYRRGSVTAATTSESGGEEQIPSTSTSLLRPPSDYHSKRNWALNEA